MLIRGVTERSYLHLSPTHHIRMNLQGNTEQNLVMATFELPSLGKEKVSIGVYTWGLTFSRGMSGSSEKEEHSYIIQERGFLEAL